MRNLELIKKILELLDDNIENSNWTNANLSAEQLGVEPVRLMEILNIMLKAHLITLNNSVEITTKWEYKKSEIIITINGMLFLREQTK